MGRRDRDPRPPVEVVGGEADDARLRTVAVGGGSGSRTRRLLAAGTVVAVLVGGLVLGDPGDDDAPSDAAEVDRTDGDDDTEPDDQRAADRTTSTTRRPRPTTTTTQPVPVLPGSGVRVLLIGGPRGSEIVDLDTGLRTTAAARGGVLRDIYDALPVSGGVVVAAGGRARLVPLPDGEPVDLGAAEQVFAHRDPTAAWLVTSSQEGTVTTATLVGIDGQVRGAPVTWEQGWFVGVSADGLLGQAGGRVYEIVPGRAPRPIAVGEPLAVSDGRLMVRSCDDTAVCAIEVWDRDLRSSRRVDVPAVQGPFYGALLVVKPGTDLAAMQQFGPTGSTLSFVDLAGGPHRPIDGLELLTGIGWLPGDLGLLVLEGDDLVRAYERGDEVIVEVLADVGSYERLVVIPG